MRIFVLLTLVIMLSCSTQSDNPLLSPWDTPFAAPPFAQIQERHYVPAFKEAMKRHMAEIRSIINNGDEPTFENTIAALDYSGELLRQVGSVFSNLNGANTNEEMQAIAKQISPLQSKHADDIRLNPELFQRVKAVHEKKDEMGLTRAQERLLQDTYNSFVRNGANLSDEQKKELRALNEQLSLLTLKFGENVLAETNDFKLVIEDQAELAGLPQWLVDQAAEAAAENDMTGKWVFTLHKPSWIPFLQYSSVRPLREKLYTAWMHIGDNDNEHDNKEIISQIVSLRRKRANLLGFASHADYVLDDNMAKNPATVYAFLQQIWAPALNRAKVEAYDMQKKIDAEGGDFRLASWDWWYYAEKIRQEKYNLNDDALRPYFELEKVKKGLFDVARNLYGLQFVELQDMPIYHEDVTAYEVKEADGSHVAVLYMDFHPRPSKRSGAWMTEFRGQYKKDGEHVAPIISIVMNFSKPTGDTPALLTLDEVLTLFHEFGHALHGMLSDCSYPGQAGTNVRRDFVELPSQIMENWAAHPQVIKTYASHYQTGESIPDELVKKIEQSDSFNQGFITTEIVAASILDMDYHSRTDTASIDDVDAFEEESMRRIGLIPEIIPRYRSSYFQHIFAGGYSAGYYSYLWAEVLDADAFEAFEETSLFDQKTATAFRENILERGDTEDPMVLYKRFRGHEPEIAPLLKRRGLM
ncbi:M3 family metallopeptidase [candidate division KSB1 bacterium]|nr:M3 family metallopeptidase [candidate division KSB1 bacterium]RQW04442.1 MAG: M3 family peptidase [candidate division KSB1 bacterium]